MTPRPEPTSEFWEDAETISQEVAAWPAWKRGEPANPPEAQHRTEAEQAVLDACAAWTVGVSDRTASGLYWGDPSPVVSAVLALRGLK